MTSVLAVVASTVTMTVNNILPNGSKTAVIGLFPKNALKVGRLMYSYNTEFGLGHRPGSKFHAQVRCPYFNVRSNPSLNRTAYGSRLACPLGEYMKPESVDTFIGLFIVVVCGLGIEFTLGLKAFMYIIEIVLYGIIILHLWECSSPGAKFLAALLMPAILLTYLMPRNIRHTISEASERRQS